MSICGHEHFRSPRDQRVAQFCEHGFYLDGLVLDPAWRVAASRGLYDYSGDFIDCFSGWISRLPRACWRKIDAFRRAGNSPPTLFRDVDFTHPARLRDAAFGDFDARSGFSSQVGSP